MTIVPRLARPAAVAALAAAALAIPATSASAEVNQQCLDGRISTATRWMGYANEYAQQGDWAQFATQVNYATWAYSSALTC